MKGYFKPIDTAQLEDLLRVSYPNTPTKAGWTFDDERITEVVKALNIRLPIKIRFSSGKYTHGSHGVADDCHRITLSQIWSASEANQTLWHELAHAVQAEKLDNPSKFYQELYKKGGSYKVNRYEVQARKFAEDNEHRMLIS